MMAILRLLAIASITVIHLGVARLNDVAGGRPVHEKVGKHLSNIMAARDKGFQIGSSSHIREAVYQNNIKNHPIATIPSKLKPIKDTKPSHTHQTPSIRSPRSLSCRHDQFACTDGLICIPENYRCDGDDDCVNASDESVSLCTPPCSDDMFACADGLKCIPSSKLKNCADDCADGSDETHATCFECVNGLKSVKMSYTCDGNNDCGDNSDEGTICTGN